jgi:putative tryptophan/tyrosine transport system substrate-binding protein
MAGVDPGLPLSRRQVVQGVGSAGLALLAACGRLPFQAPLHQPAKQPRLGILWPGLAPIGPAPELDAFRDGLRERGWLEGQNLTVEYRFAERGEGEALSLAVELVRLGMDVIAAPGTPAVRAAKNATSVIPIVMMSSSDAIADGFVAGLARPGGNVTGLTQMLSQLGAKRLELLKEIVPAISRVAILWRNPDTGLSLRELQVVARALELQLQSVDVEGLDELERAFDAAARWGADALITLRQPFTVTHRTRVAALAAERRLPAMYESRDFVDVGGLIAYGPNLPDMSRRAATYVDKILRGERPANLPVEQPMKFDCAINLQTAHALGLTIPHQALLQATEVLE